jgi:hypothetical protein
MSIAVASNIETSHQAQPSALLCKVYNRIKNWLLDEPVDDCEYAASGYFGKCSCASEAIKYKCDTVLGHKICLPSANATLNHTDCAATCT